MKSAKPRSYTSPLRAQQAQATRAAILAAVARWMRERPEEELTLGGVAQAARIERRTVHRHFLTKEALLAAFWKSINEQLTAQTLPRSGVELLAAPRSVFAAFDQQAGIIRASLHSAAGREMRLASVPARRRAFRAALRDASPGATAANLRRLECVAHALYSAAAWEAMSDYAGASGKEAGGAVAWALSVLAQAASRKGGA